MKYCIIFFIIFLASTANATSFARLEGWNKERQSEDHEGAIETFLRSCKVFKNKGPNAKLKYPGGKTGDWIDVCEKARELEARAALGELAQGWRSIFFERNFTPLKVSDNGDTDGLFTGYHVPQLNGSYKRTKRYKHAIYKRPPGKLRKKYDREQIENGALQGHNLELLYVDDPVELFFLHIQGSGRVKMRNGELINVGYHAANSRKYHAIGKELVRLKELKKKKVTAQKIKKWLRDNPKKADEVMNTNPSYVYFRKLDKKGARGAQGVPVTEGRSLAVDDEMMPYGLPIWLETELPTMGNPDYNRMFIAQDTGGAIRGAVRGDVFFGYGEEAAELSGKMKQRGEYYILLPNDLVKRLIKEQ